jgi:hypothetical protein
MPRQPYPLPLLKRKYKNGYRKALGLRQILGKEGEATIPLYPSEREDIKVAIAKALGPGQILER